MADFFRVLPLQFGSLTRDLVALVMGAGVGLGHPRLVAVGPDLPHPLDSPAPDVPPIGRRPSTGAGVGRRRSRDLRRTLSGRPNDRSDGLPTPIRRSRRRSPTAARRTARSRRPGRRRPPRRRIPLLADLDRPRRDPGRVGAVPVRLLARPPGRRRAGHARARERGAFQPFWDTYHTISDRYAGGEVDRDDARPGRHPRDDRLARRPVLAPT